MTDPETTGGGASAGASATSRVQCVNQHPWVGGETPRQKRLVLWWPVSISLGPVRNESTPEMRAFWARVEATAAEVATWPEWKRAGIDIASYRSEPRRLP